MNSDNREEALRERFNEWYKVANPWGLRNSFNDRVRQSKLVRLLENHRYQNALDIGCGEGDVSRLASRYAENVMAIDVSDEVIAIARNETPEANVTYERAGFLEFSSKTNFDLILCLEVLYYLPKDQHDAFLTKMVGLLAENGVAFITLVVSGRSQYGEYFEFDEAVSLLDKYFKILDVGTFVPKGRRQRFFRAALRRLAGVFAGPETISRFDHLFLAPATAAYQASFLCVKR